MVQVGDADGGGQNRALQAYAEGLRAQVGQDEGGCLPTRMDLRFWRPRWTRSPEEAKWTDGPAALEGRDGGC